VREGETGLLVNSERPHEVSDAVRELLDNRIAAQRLGAAGRRAVETYYNWNRVAAEVDGIGHELGRSV
jgi:glycosyltransferase involved in cell wall biosynthesis